MSGVSAAPSARIRRRGGLPDRHRIEPRTSLFRLSDCVGSVYGTEDLSVFLYSLVKMKKWRNVLELGTGLGVTTFWLGQALRENARGRVVSIDDGRHFAPVERWSQVRSTLSANFPNIKTATYFRYLRSMRAELGLGKEVAFVRQKIDAKRMPGLFKGELDLVFSDFSHAPLDILEVLANFLPYLSTGGALFVDGASTNLSSCLLLEKIVDQLNQGRIPQILLEPGPRARLPRLRALVERSKFRLTHLVENKQRVQNSTAWLQVEPLDFVPYASSQIVA